MYSITNIIYYLSSIAWNNFIMFGWSNFFKRKISLFTFRILLGSLDIIHFGYIFNAQAWLVNLSVPTFTTAYAPFPISLSILNLVIHTLSNNSLLFIIWYWVSYKFLRG